MLNGGVEVDIIDGLSRGPAVVSAIAISSCIHTTMAFTPILN